MVVGGEHDLALLVTKIGFVIGLAAFTVYGAMLLIKEW